MQGQFAVQYRPKQAVKWRRCLAALFVIPALTGCAPVAVVPGQTPNAPYQQADPRHTSGMH